MLAPFVRIAMRVFAGMLMGAGWVGEGDTDLFMDPELIGAITLALTEGWYLAARKWGWET